ncbi:hypothetical protein YSY43_00360 [Paenibacillus sp. YSY-4.3]
MDSVEKQLAEEKQRLDVIAAPEELEDRLRSALNGAAPAKRKRISPVWRAVAAALILIVIFGYNYNAFAFYGKKLLGFDELISSTLQELNDQGMGQLVDKKTTLSDGTELTINGIMADANQLIMYYTLTNPKGIDNFSDNPFKPSKITGFLTDSQLESGVSQSNADKTEVKGTFTFEPVSSFAKRLMLHFWDRGQNNQLIDHTLSFAYDPNQAMQTEVKQSIRKKAQVDKGTINFQSITATPTMTMIEGSLSVDNFDRLPRALDGIELIANGTPVEKIGSGHGSSIGGRNFDLRYNPLPKPLKSLELVMKDFVGYQQLDQKLPLISTGEEPFTLEGKKELWVKKVSVTSQGVEITIATEDDVLLDGVSIETQDETTTLRTTIGQIETKLEDGTFLKERTLLFDTQTKPEYLYIKGMHYMKEYNVVVAIPVD